jgi:hypothetical protein
MRKSREVPLALLAAMAVSITACRDQVRDCVDAQGRKLLDSQCESGYRGAHYVYGGRSGGHVGDAVIGGGVTRGGFGGTGGSGAGE